MWCAIIFLSLGCGALSEPVKDLSLQEFIVGNRRFTAAAYKELIKVEPGNIIISPLSAEIVLALTREGSRGETANQFTTGLSLPNSTEKIQTIFKTLLPKLKKSDESLTLLSANKIYIGSVTEPSSEFSAIAKNVYDSALENIDFTNNLKAAQTINKWVEDNTNEKIKNLITPLSINLGTRIILVNALYFNGKWASKFEESKTTQKKFYITKGSTVSKDTMHQLEHFNYYENPTLNAKFLELPYVGGDVSMVIVLPNEVEGLYNLEQNIEQVLQPQPFKKEKVDVALPRFTIETEIKFIPILQSVGIQRAFTDEADFTGISPSFEKVFISQVIQKAYINVTETGTEAAAATAVITGVRGGAEFIPPTEFHVDRPFFYYIKVHDMVFVAGRYIK